MPAYIQKSSGPKSSAGAKGRPNPGVNIAEAKKGGMKGGTGSVSTAPGKTGSGTSVPKPSGESGKTG